MFNEFNLNTFYEFNLNTSNYKPKSNGYELSHTLNRIIPAYCIINICRGFNNVAIFIRLFSIALIIINAHER